MDKSRYVDRIPGRWRDVYRDHITQTLSVPGFETADGYMYWVDGDIVVFSELDETYSVVCRAIRMRRNVAKTLLGCVRRKFVSQLTECYTTIDNMKDILDDLDDALAGR